MQAVSCHECHWYSELPEGNRGYCYNFDTIHESDDACPSYMELTQIDPFTGEPRPARDFGPKTVEEK